MLKFVLTTFLLHTTNSVGVEAAPLQFNRNPTLHHSYPQGYRRVGDMLFPESYFHGDDTSRNGIPVDNTKWPGGVVPYEIPALRPANLKIKRAMEEFHSKTRIRFVPRTNQRNWIKITTDDGCTSFVGMTGGMQELSLAKGCLTQGRIVHLFLHVVGFFDEQHRSDRDKYITINWKNVKKGEEHLFEKLEKSKNRLFGPFDVQSIMMEGPLYQSKDGVSPTMVSKMCLKWTSVNCKPGLAESDVTRINKLYG